MKRQLFVLMISIFLIVGCTQTEPTGNDNLKQATGEESNDEQTIETEEPGYNKKEIGYTWYSSPLFKIYYPDGWDVDGQISAPGVFIFSSPLEDNTDKFSEEFIVEIWESDESTSEEFNYFEVGLMDKNDWMINKENITYKGKEAYLMEYEGTDIDYLGVYYKTIFFRNDEWVYRLHYAIEKSKLDKYKPIMENVLDKFEIGTY